MIPITLYLLWLLLVLFCAGSVAQHLLHRLAQGSGRYLHSSRDVASVLLIGLILITTLTSVVSLVHPIDLAVHLGLSIVMIVLGGRYFWHFLRGFSFLKLKRIWILWISGLGCVATMIFVAGGETTHYDTGLYHAQMVKWNREFGVVPGLANLQGRLGFDSAWDTFSAFIDQGYFTDRSFHFVCLVIGVIFMLVCFQGFRRLFDGNRSLGTLLRCFGVVIILHDYRDLLPSLSTDWPSELLIYYLVILTVERIENSETLSRCTWDTREFALLASACAFALTIKLSSLPVLLFLLVWWKLAESKVRATALVMLATSCVILPFVARNIVLSGYVVYPSTAIDLFNVDWKVPRADVDLMKSMLKYWAINPVDDWYRAEKMGLTQQFQTWVEFRGAGAMEALKWVCLGLVAWVSAASLKRGRRLPNFGWNATISCILATGIIFCLLNAPDPRFAMTWCFAFGLFATAWLVSLFMGGRAAPASCDKIASYSLVIVFTLFLIRDAGIKRFLRNPGHTLFSISDYPVPEFREVKSEHGAIVRIPVKGDQAWGAAIPTVTPLGFNPWLEMRGSALGAGFRVTKAGFAIGRESLQAELP